MLPNSQETVDLVTFTEEIFNGKLHFLCSVWAIICFIICVNATNEHNIT